MSSSTATLTVDQWQFLLQKTMQALQRAQEAVQGRFGFWGLVNGLWRCARDLKDLNAYLKVVSESPDGVMKQEVIESQIASLHTLLKSIDDLMEVGKRKGLTNRTVTGASRINIGPGRIHRRLS